VGREGKINGVPSSSEDLPGPRQHPCRGRSKENNTNGRRLWHWIVKWEEAEGATRL